MIKENIIFKIIKACFLFSFNKVENVQKITREMSKEHKPHPLNTCLSHSKELSKSLGPVFFYL